MTQGVRLRIAQIHRLRFDIFLASPGLRQKQPEFGLTIRQVLFGEPTHKSRYRRLGLLEQFD